MKRDTQQKARLLIRNYLDTHPETGKEMARRCDVCRATFYRFIAGDDVSMGAIEKILAGVGYGLDVVLISDDAVTQQQEGERS